MLTRDILDNLPIMGANGRRHDADKLAVLVNKVRGGATARHSKLRVCRLSSNRNLGKDELKG